MMYGGFLGALLGFNAVPLLTAIPLIVGLIVWQGAWGMVFRRSWISGEPSQYGAYVEKLKRAGVVYRAPWMAYLLQTALIWGTFGFVVYAACRWAVPGSWWVRTLVIYLGIGLLAAVDHVTSGKQGRAGLGVAFVAVILLWPMVLVTHWRSRR